MLKQLLAALAFVGAVSGKPLTGARHLVMAMLTRARLYSSISMQRVWHFYHPEPGRRDRLRLLLHLQRQHRRRHRHDGCHQHRRRARRDGRRRDRECPEHYHLWRR